MNNQEATLSHLQAVFRRTLAMYQPGAAMEGLKPGAHLNAWDWGPGIALYGLQRAYPLLPVHEQQSYFDFWRDWVKTYRERGTPRKAINSAILLTVLWRTSLDAAFPLTDDERDELQAYCRQRVAFYLHSADRVPSGAFAHTVAQGSPDSSRQVWADNLFMLVLLIAQVAVTKENAALFGQMVAQLKLHYEHLTDPVTKLLYHGWQADEQNAVGGAPLNLALWGRGNGWAAMGVAELMELAALRPFEAFREAILQIALPHFRALLACQTSDGRWRTLLDQSASYPETSATAAIAYAFLKGARQGWLGAEFERAGRKALRALEEQISPDGEVQGVSGSTPLLATLEAYNTVPLEAPTTWGQGIGLLALSAGL